MILFDKIILRVANISAWGYIFFSAVPYSVAGKNITTGLMGIVTLLLVWRNKLSISSFDWLFNSLLVVILLAFLSAILGPYSAESLIQLRKDGLPFLLVFLVLTNRFQPDRCKTAKLTVVALILGFVVKESMAIWAGITNDFQFSIYETRDSNLPRWLDFFAADTPYYLPFLLGPLYFWQIHLWQRIILLLLTLAAITIVVFSGVRTAFIFVIATVLFLTIYRFWNRKKLLFTIFILIISCIFILMQNISSYSMARYLTITSGKTYMFGGDGSVSERYAIAKGVLEVSRERLLLGYGSGWKKLPRVAESEGHMDRWRTSKDPVDGVTYNYFTYGEGRVNPHNLYIALLFENGLVGLIAYLSLILAAGIGVFKILRKSQNSLETGIGASGLLYIMISSAGGLTGGVWLSSPMLVTVVCVAILQNNLTAQCTHSDVLS